METAEGRSVRATKGTVRHVDWLILGGGILLLILGGWLGYPLVQPCLTRAGLVAIPTKATEQPERMAGVDDHSLEIEPTRTPLRVNSLPSDSFEDPDPVIIPAIVPSSTTYILEPQIRSSGGMPPTRIVVPSIGVDAPIVRVSWYEAQVGGATQAVWRVPNEYAAGWHETSAMLGEPGNTVLNGHNTNYGEVFRDLYKLEANDEVVLYSHGISRTYLVSQTLILPEAGQPLEARLKNARHAMPTDDERLTLVTCHPYGSLLNRLIVIARPTKREMISDPSEEQ